MPVPPRHALPHAPKDAVIGLFGGSFDPAHEGHVQVSRHALKRLQLRQLWWLVSPGNPLKAHGPAALERRVAYARALMQHPQVQITSVEAVLGTRFTADTLVALQRLYPRQRFVWIMGADNLASLHHWESWHRIMRSVPVAVMARPGQCRPALSSVAARSYAAARIPAEAAAHLGQMRAPAWCFLNIPMLDTSSSKLRELGAWRGIDAAI